MALQMSYTPATGIPLANCYFRLQGVAYDRTTGWSFEVRGYANQAAAVAGKDPVYQQWHNPSSADQTTYFAGVIANNGANLAAQAYTWLLTQPFFSGATSV